jgi:hypothetical protein
MVARRAPQRDGWRRSGEWWRSMGRLTQPGLAGALGGADQRPAPRAPGQNQRPAPRAPERPRLGGPSYDARSTPRSVRGPGPGPPRPAAAAVTSDSPPRGLCSPLQLNCLNSSKLRARQPQQCAPRLARGPAQSPLCSPAEVTTPGQLPCSVTTALAASSAKEPEETSATARIHPRALLRITRI